MFLPLYSKCEIMKIGKSKRNKIIYISTGERDTLKYVTD